MLRKVPIFCIFLSVFFSSTLILFDALARNDQFIQCQVLYHENTVFSLYTDSGSGYNEHEVVHVNVISRPFWRSLKFRVKNIVFQGLRLDFSSQENCIHIKQCTIQDKEGFPIIPYQDVPIKALHQVQLVPKEMGEYVVIGQGEDPQILFDIPWKTLFFKRIQFGFWFSCIFLLYPLCFFGLYALLGMGSNKKIRIEKTKLHRLFMGSSLVFWLLAGLAYWSASSRHHVLPTLEEGEELLGIPSFTAQEINLRRPDGLAIHGRLYQSENSKLNRGNILLLHGNYTKGQLYPLYPLMAESLARRGFRVLTIDFAGYGLSADPFASNTRLRSDRKSETEAALAFLKALPGGKKNVCIIGHSLGANSALWVGLRDTEVSALVLIGPPRRVGERYYDVPDLNYFWERVMKSGQVLYGREQFPAWYTQKMFQEEFLDQDLIYALPNLAKGGHKSIYFMDGGREAEEDLDFLRRYVQRVSAPCAYATMLAADHNFNVPPALERLHYVPNVLQDAIEVLDGWCSQRETWARRTWLAVQNVLRLLFPFR
jgi:pimeloyl-ACP methyl ester carboxylesterase